MSTIETVLLSLLVLDAIALTVLVLIQQGKGADVGAAFGSGSANTMFGSAGSASFFTKATAGLAIGFFLITFALAYLANERAGSVGSIGIPQTSSQQTELTETQEGVNSASEEDISADDMPSGDVPTLEAPPPENSDVPELDP